MVTFGVKQYPSITALMHALVKNAPSKLTAADIADLVGKPYATLMSELNPARPDHKLDADLLVPLAELTGSDSVAHFFARECGGVYVSLPPATDQDHPVHQQCMVAIKDFGELMGQTGKALEDGTITRDEAEQLSRLGYGAIQAISALLLAVDKAKE